jgi:hypothetical protein
MARKTTKKNKSKTSFQKSERKEDVLKDLDRFAGFSEEEGDDDGEQVKPAVETDDESLDQSNDRIDEDSSSDEREESGNDEEEDDDSSSDDDEYGVPFVPDATASVGEKKATKDISDSDSDSSSDDNDPQSENSQNGMAGAMARILGLSAVPKKATEPKSVVLSKTITPLQKQQKKEKEEEDALRLKRKQRREVNLTALHIPLSAATSRPIAGKDSDSGIVAKAMAREIEVESMHRRVATRGVVALFNAITQHQQQKAQQQVSSFLNY